jgi:hypothetical protein
MSVECGECEHDLRGGHGFDCSKHKEVDPEHSDERFISNMVDDLSDHYPFLTENRLNRIALKLRYAEELYDVIMDVLEQEGCIAQIQNIRPCLEHFAYADKRPTTTQGTNAN